MLHLKIEEVAGKTATVLDETVLAKLGASLGDTLMVEDTAVSIKVTKSETDGSCERHVKS